MPTRNPHPLRAALHNEVHSRPYERMVAPLAVSHMALLGESPAVHRQHLMDLLADHHLPQPAPETNHLSIDLPGCRLRWEQHSEFTTYTVWRALRQEACSEAFESPACAALPADWLCRIPGQLLVAIHVAVVSTLERALRDEVDTLLDADAVVGSSLADGELRAYSDFRLHPDGFGRWIVAVAVRDMSPRRLGRYVQRLLEVDTYRMTALLGLPVAKAVARDLSKLELALVELAARPPAASESRDREHLAALTLLARDVERLCAQHFTRFSATAAYFDLVERRIAELREERHERLQTIGEFIDRRLRPATDTTAWVSRRLRALTARVAHASELLRTAVEVVQQERLKQLLGAINERQEVQFRLQTAIEGLSIAAITYYAVGLVGYATKGLQKAGLPLSPDVVTALALPLVAASMWWSVRRVRTRLEAMRLARMDASP